MTNLTDPIFGLFFLQRNNIILDMRQVELKCPFISMQLKPADNSYSNITELMVNPTKVLIQQRKQSVVYIKSELYTEKEVTGIIQASPHLEKNHASSSAQL